MENEEVQKLIQLREFAIQYYASLGVTALTSDVAVTKAKDAASFSSSVVTSIDALIANYVTFTTKEEKSNSED